MSSAPHPPDPIFVLRGTQCPITCLQFDPANSQVLYSGDAEGFVTVWSLATRRAVHKHAAHPGKGIVSVHCLSSSGSLLTHGRDDRVSVWDTQQTPWRLTGTIALKSLSFCGSGVYCNASGDFLVGPGKKESVVTIFNIDSQVKIASLSPQQTLGMCMSLELVPSENGSMPSALIGYEEGTVALWDLQSHEELSVAKLHNDPVMCLSYSPVKNLGVSGSADDKLVMWSVSDGSQLTRVSEVSVTNPGFSAVRVRDDGKIFVAGGWDGRVRVFGLKRARPLAVLTYHRQSVHCLAFSTERLLACGSKDGHISLWDIYQNT